MGRRRCCRKYGFIPGAVADVVMYLIEENRPQPQRSGGVPLAAKSRGVTDQCWACARTESSTCETNCCLALGSFEIASICFCHFGAGPRLRGELSDSPNRSSNETDKARR